MEINLQEVKLQKMKLNNFKVQKIVEIEFNEGLTEILADNAQGKSSIRDAFCFVFTGTNSEGKASFDAINHNAGLTSVEVEYKDKSGVINTIKRTQRLTPAGSRQNKVYVNDKVIPISEFKKIIDKDLFLSIVNPEYFLSLTPAKAKGMLLSLMDIKHINVMLKMDKEVANQIKEDTKERITSEDAQKRRLEINSLIKEQEELILLKKDRSKYLIDKSYDLEKETLNMLSVDYVFLDEEKEKVVKNISLEKLENLFEKEHIKKTIKNNNERFKEIKKERKELAKQILKAEKEIVRLKDLYKAYDIYIETELLLINEELSKEYEDINIKLRTDDDKIVFEKEYNGTNIDVSSLSERIKFGVELSTILSKYSKHKYPIMIDNAESITTLEKTRELKQMQLVSFAVIRGLDLSIVKNDMVEDLESLKTLPRKDINETFVYRLFNEDVVDLY